MAIALGKDHTAPPFGTGVISATFTTEQELVDVTNRDNAGAGDVGYRANKAGFKAETWEIECHDPAGLVASLTAQMTNGQWSVMSVAENVAVDGATTFTVTCRKG
jgi:hypothetical protein